MVIGAVLAGGEARRMGRDKRRLRLGGATLLERNLLFLHDLFPTVALSLRGPGQIPEPLPPRIQIVPDVVTGSPLAGIGSLLRHFDRPVFVLAADVAFPDPAAVRRVLAAFAGADIALPIVDDHLEPLHAVYGPGCLPHIERLLARGTHSILDLLPEVRVATVPFTTADPFFNVNTPDDWREARRRLAASEPAAGSRPPAAAAPAAGAERPAVLGIIGRPGSGKTTLIERLIPELAASGLRVATVKSVARFEIDVPGKDSWRHAQAGAETYAVASAAKLAFVTELRAEAALSDIVRRYFAGYDVVLCEGYRREAPRVVEVFRRGAGHDEPLCGPEETLALVTDAGLSHDHRFGLDESGPLARFLERRLGLTGPAT